ncbi:MAG: hypothetical protein II670_06480, partial [Alphaproteobacteria bacterium]|nr:hypothetical protein [Alphaproteobacteria bacterium]
MRITEIILEINGSEPNATSHTQFLLNWIMSSDKVKNISEASTSIITILSRWLKTSELIPNPRIPYDPIMTSIGILPKEYFDNSCNSKHIITN